MDHGGAGINPTSWTVVAAIGCPGCAPGALEGACYARRTMAGNPLHATLTEDEDVLVEALRPGPASRLRALFAFGNGDAALALVAAGAGRVEVADLFDPAGLAAQRAAKVAALERCTPGEARALFLGLGRVDSTASWGRAVARIGAMMRPLFRWPRLLRLVLRPALLLAPAFYPPPERMNSLGVRQLLEDPAPAMMALLERLPPDGDLVGAHRFRYLSVEGLTRLATRLDRITTVNPGAESPGYTGVYLSNLLDYLSDDVWTARARVLAGLCHSGAPWLVHSTWRPRGDEIHPRLRPVVTAGLLAVDREATTRARAVDRIGVYPSTTVLRVRSGVDLVADGPGA